MNRFGYYDKMCKLLDAEDTYRKLKKNPIKSIKNKISELVKNWKSKMYIDKKTYNELLITEGQLPRAYGLPKVHKPNIPMRIIISSIGSPSYNLAQYIQNILSTHLPKPKSYIKDSKHLKDLLNKINIPNNFKLISLDVSSLFTNIPRELVTAAI